MERAPSKRAVGALFLLLLAAAEPAPAARRPKDPLNEWATGPIRYIMTRSEAKLFKSLESPAERQDFVRNFWRRRDPDPRTPENEARLIFWRRVAEANRTFGIGGIPGWKTDRGKIYVLLGPPDDIDTKENYDTKIQDIANRGLMRWTYRGLRQSSNPVKTVVAFVRGNDNDWRLTDDPNLSSPFFDVNSPLNEQTYMGRGLSLITDYAPWGASNLSTAMDLGRLQEIPTEQEIMRAVVSAESFVGSYNGAVAWHFVANAAGERMIALTAALRRTELSPPWDGSVLGLAQRFAISAAIKPQAGGAELDFAEETWVSEPSPAPDDPWLRFQTIRKLPADFAGRWRLSAVVVDRPGGGAATIYADIDSPADPLAAPRMDGPILAAQLVDSPSPERQDLGPFRVGDAVVVPKIGSEYGPSEPFALFVAVQPPDSAPGPVVLEWTIERVAGDAAPAPAPWGKAGRLADGRGPRAWQLAPGSIPPGRYTVRFAATAENGISCTRTVSFSVLEGNASPP